MMEMPETLDSEAFAAAGRVLLGYAVVLAMPGPNALAVGAVAALRGFAGAVPLCLGVVCGVGTVAALCLALPSASPEPGHWGDAGRIAGAVLLLSVALRLFHRKTPTAANGGGRLVGFLGGFCTAVSNPITAAFFASQFLGAIGAAPSGRAGGVLVVLGAAAAALTHGLAMAGLLARPGVRRAALAWHRPICLAGATALLLVAGLTLRPVIAMASDGRHGAAPPIFPSFSCPT
jgi:threonine/homoserine/homoserine lactone efflux protein